MTAIIPELGKQAVNVAVKAIDIGSPSIVKTEKAVVPEYVTLVETFLTADKEYKKAEEEMLDGTTLVEISVTSKDPSQMKTQWRQALDHLRKLLDDRNAKLHEAQTAMRGTVQLSGLQERGFDGKTSTVREGPFTVASNTWRSFNGEDLMRECQKRGVLKELLDLQYTDKKTSEVCPAVRQTWEIKYDTVKDFLLSKEMGDVLRGAAYHETEKTPMVKGPKPLAFLGDKLEGGNDRE